MEGNLFFTVNGVEMVINVVVWKAVAKLDMVGVQKFEESANGYSKMQTYKGMLIDPTTTLRNHLGVGGLTVEDRMHVYLITYILTPRSSNHT